MAQIHFNLLLGLAYKQKVNEKSIFSFFAYILSKVQ